MKKKLLAQLLIPFWLIQLVFLPHITHWNLWIIAVTGWTLFSIWFANKLNK